jgi:hypothetical protein
MAQFAAPEHLRGDHTIILVGQDERGHWVVEENHGLIEGAFRTKYDAMRFAQSERSQFPGAIIMVTQAEIKRRAA